MPRTALVSISLCYMSFMAYAGPLLTLWNCNACFLLMRNLCCRGMASPLQPLAWQSFSMDQMATTPIQMVSPDAIYATPMETRGPCATLCTVLHTLLENLWPDLVWCFQVHIIWHSGAQPTVCSAVYTWHQPLKSKSSYYS